VGGEDVGDACAGKAQGVVDEVAFSTGERSFAGAFFSEENNLAVGRAFVGFASDDGADDEVAEVGERTEEAPHQVERVGGVFLQVGAVDDTEVFRNDL